MIDLDKIETAFRRLATENIERQDMSAAQKAIALELIEPQVAFQRFLARCQNEDRQPAYVGWHVGLMFSSMLWSAKDNLQGYGLKSFIDCFDAGWEAGDKAQTADEGHVSQIIKPETVQ